MHGTLACIVGCLVRLPLLIKMPGYSAVPRAPASDEESLSQVRHQAPVLRWCAAKMFKHVPITNPCSDVSELPSARRDDSSWHPASKGLVRRSNQGTRSFVGNTRVTYPRFAFPYHTYCVLSAACRATSCPFSWDGSTRASTGSQAPKLGRRQCYRTLGGERLPDATSSFLCAPREFASEAEER